MQVLRGFESDRFRQDSKKSPDENQGIFSFVLPVKIRLKYATACYSKTNINNAKNPAEAGF
ncbi:hypothetical protein CSQ88_13430 [Iodobacter sp. BJB302]|nr:hypothetical protein CSQ88_13430 [Iodobacter sp. BJB302]